MPLKQATILNAEQRQAIANAQLAVEAVHLDNAAAAASAERQQEALRAAFTEEEHDLARRR